MNAAAPDDNDDIPTLSFGFPHDRSAIGTALMEVVVVQGRGATAKTPLRPGRLGPTSHLRSLSLSPERSGALPRTEERELVIMTLGPSAGADGNAVALRRVPRWIAPPRYP